MLTLEEAKSFVVNTEAERKVLENRRDQLERQRDTAEGEEGSFHEARLIIASAAIRSQESVCGFIEEIVSLALQAVFGRGYGFRLDYRIQRNKAEATPILIRDGRELGLKDEVGGGIVDVVSFAMRVAFWSLENPTLKTLVLDEPFKFVSKDRTAEISEMVRAMSEKLGIQFIIVSHDAGLIGAADRTWEVTQRHGISQIEKEES